ncbi:MAG: type II/IV secretion system ATPase subunit, partial [Candidatus Bathyarchaeia archaeon]
FSVIDLINIGTLNAKIAAYLWLILENKLNLMIIGGTGAGKTSTLNALTSLISPNDKLITVEEVAELNPPHENWVQLVSRRGFRFGTADSTSISLFDLVRLSLRYRPDYIIVGEVRGEEAYVLFQAIATGHGGICTMHADSLDHAVKRLTSPPMNVAEVYIPLMNVCLYIARVDLPSKEGPRFGRRIRNLWEVVDFGKYNELATWLPTKDEFQIDLTKSILLDRIAAMRGVKKEDLLKEIDRRERLLKAMAERNIRDQREVAQIIMRYYYQCRGIGIPHLEAITLQSPTTLEATFAYLMASLDLLSYSSIGNLVGGAEAGLTAEVSQPNEPKEVDKALEVSEPKSESAVKLADLAMETKKPETKPAEEQWSGPSTIVGPLIGSLLKRTDKEDEEA